ncbi:MAG: lysozyme [Bacteroidales bacterium]
MKTSKQGIDLIKKFEGLRLEAYYCSANVLTIGYGTTQGVKLSDKITLEQADAFLQRDLQKFEQAVNNNLQNLGQNQFDALVSFVYNVGISAFEKSILLKKAKVNHNDTTIRDEFARWDKAGGQQLAGLAKRRSEEAALYFS